MSFRILGGDCIARMNMLDKESVDNVITDPPYEIGFMGKGWDNTGIAYNPATWRACHRVLKPNGYMLVFGATKTHHRIAHAIERAGFEIVDITAWCYGTGFPKSHNISKALDKRGGKDISWFADWFKNWRTEKGLSQKSISENFLSKSGKVTGCVHNWENGLSLPTNDDFNKLCKLYDLPFSSLKEAEREVIARQKVSKRSPENPFQIKSSKEGIMETTLSSTDIAKKWEGWGTALKPAWEPIIVARKKGSQRNFDYSQFYYIAKPSKSEKNAGLEAFEDKMSKNAYGNRVCSLCNKHELQTNLEKRCLCENPVWGHGRLTPTKNIHPTVKPVKLMRKLIEEFTEEGSTVLDPFTGSGTTGMASVLIDRKFIGCELTPEYIPLAKARIGFAQENKSFFD